MSLTITVTSAIGFPADLAQKLSALLHGIAVDIEVYPQFAPTKWEGGFLPIKVLSIPPDLIGTSFPSPILSGVEISFDDGVASLRSPASRSVTDYAMFCLSAAAIASVTRGRLEMEGIQCKLSPDHPFADAIEAIKSFVTEADESDMRQVRFESWDAVE